jgi:hypothetical protein
MDTEDGQRHLTPIPANLALGRVRRWGECPGANPYHPQILPLYSD